MDPQLTLKERVALAVAYERKLKLHKDSAHLEQLLLQAKIIDHKLAPDAIEVETTNREKQVRFDLDGVVFLIHSYQEIVYGDDGEPVGEKDVARLRAHRGCVHEGCTRFSNYPYVDNISKLSDLQRLYSEEEYGRPLSFDCGLGDRHGQPHSMETDGIEEQELKDLPW